MQIQRNETEIYLYHFFYDLKVLNGQTLKQLHYLATNIAEECRLMLRWQFTKPKSDQGDPSALLGASSTKSNVKRE